MLASPPGLLVLLGRVQFLAEHPSSPVRYRLRGFGQLAADELCHYAVATATRGIAVQAQIIGVLPAFEEVLRCPPIRITPTCSLHCLPAAPLPTHTRPDFPSPAF